MDDNARPQAIFTVFDGFNRPSVLNMPNTNVAESAEVMKNIAITNIVIKERILPSESCCKTPNVDVSTGNGEIISVPCCSKFNADTPNIEKKISVTIVGAKITPIMNCFIVRPLETLAINIPTNGAQEIHQAQ